MGSFFSVVKEFQYEVKRGYITTATAINIYFEVIVELLARTRFPKKSSFGT